MKEELLEILAMHAGCQYLSDLHLPWAAVSLANVLPALPAERFSLCQFFILSVPHSQLVPSPGAPEARETDCAAPVPGRPGALEP